MGVGPGTLHGIGAWDSAWEWGLELSMGVGPGTQHGSGAWESAWEWDPGIRMSITPGGSDAQQGLKTLT